MAKSKESNLFAGESAITTVRQSIFAVLSQMIMGVGVFIVVIAAWIIIPATVFGLKIQGPLHLALLIIIVGDILYCSVVYMKHISISFELTDHRVVLSSGVLSRSTESIPLDRIQNIAIRQAFSDRLVGCGNIEIASAGRDGVEVLRWIPKPQGFMGAIMQASEGRSNSSNQGAGMQGYQNQNTMPEQFQRQQQNYPPQQQQNYPPQQQQNYPPQQQQNYPPQQQQNYPPQQQQPYPQNPAQSPPQDPQQ